MNHIGTREIATERLTLRRFEIEDAENMFYNWANDPEVTKYLTWPAHESVDTTETILKEWISKYDEKDFYQWAIELNDLEQPIGTISAIKTDERVESVEIGYCIGKRFWNNGYMTEALTAIIRFFINEVGAGRIWARHDTENPNSGKVMVAAGMDYEGTLRHAGFNNQGICDEAVYAKVRSAALDEEPEEETPEQQAVTTKVMGEDGVMRNVISDETMEYVGILAKLELSPEEAEAAKLMADAKALEEAGCFCIVLEKVPAKLAEEVTKAVSCATIGIGAGNKTDGQVLVYADMLGMNKGFKPKFLRQYANLYEIMTDAIGRYVQDVKSSDFPNESESY
mgnify:CR=1 FL=1